VFNITSESCVAFLDPLIVAWDIDLRTFSIEIALNPKVAPAKLRKFEFLEKEAAGDLPEESGLREFLKERSLSADATPDEIDFLQGLRFNGERRPTAIYYYRELQNLRDPLHFQRK
jgi:hypothetical protein